MRKETKIFVGLIFLAVILRLLQLGKFGLQQDPAHFSFRALGWTDFLAAAGQSSPIFWFEKIPWWGNLSFSDHPPLGFFFQKISFTLFGESSFAALLPFALSGIAATWLIFVIVKKLRSEREALLAALLYAISSYAVWTVRGGFLEGWVQLFTVLGFGSLLYFYKEGKWRYLVIWSVACGLALLSKYTAAFLLPAGLIFLLIYRRRVFLNYRFYLAFSAIIPVLSPLIVYNFMVWKTRGHFDSVISTALKIPHEDYSIIASGRFNLNLLDNFRALGETFVNNISWPLIILGALALCYGIFCAARKSERREAYVSSLLILFAAAMLEFVFASSNDRYLSIIVPIAVLIVAYSVCEFYESLRRQKKSAQWVSALICLAVAWEFFYAVNTNLFRTPMFAKGAFYSSARFYDTGYEELDHYLRSSVIKNLPPRREVAALTPEVKNYNFRNREVVLIDERLNWFSRFWYFTRYSFYHDLPFMTFTDLQNIVEQNGMGDDPYQLLRTGGALGFWVVLGGGGNLVNTENESYNYVMNELQSALEANGVMPAKEISNSFGETVLKVYHFR